MGKSSSLNSGFLILYDWLPALEMLDGDDFKKLLMALIRLQREGIPLPDFDNQIVEVFAKMIAPVIKRRIDGQVGGNKAQEVPTQVPTQVPTPPKIRKDKIRKDKINTTPTPPQEGTDATAERFNKFWAVYPRKVGKSAALKAFEKINPSEQLTQRMIEAIQVQKNNEQWRKNNGQYIPNPATWLNQSRWLDECPARIGDISLEEFFA